MEFETYSHKHGKQLLDGEYKELWIEISEALKSIKDSDLIKQFPKSSNNMSISSTVNDLIRERLTKKGWTKEAQIFQDEEYSQKRETVWRLDFAKKDVSVEVSFNHGEALAWNLTKPVLASEQNHVRKAIQTNIGVIILVTEEFKKAGAFDNAVGSYEKAIRYLKPMDRILTVPLLLIGLKAPKSFVIKKTEKKGRHVGIVKKI